MPRQWRDTAKHEKGMGWSSLETYFRVKNKILRKKDRIIKEHALDPDPLRYFQHGWYIHLLVPAGPGWEMIISLYSVNNCFQLNADFGGNLL
jgi:hypothetical protein